MACVLDPRFKDLPFLGNDKRDLVYELLRDEYDKLPHRAAVYTESVGAVAPSSSSSSSSSSTSSSKYTVVREARAREEKKRAEQERKDQKLEEDLADLYNTPVVKGPSTRALVVDEVSKYLSEPLPPKRDDPLLWWSNNRNVYPRLARLALRFLCVQGTSTPIERIWSVAGNILTPKRASMDTDKVEQHVFLSENVEYIDK